MLFMLDCKKKVLKAFFVKIQLIEPSPHSDPVDSESHVIKHWLLRKKKLLETLRLGDLSYQKFHWSVLTAESKWQPLWFVYLLEHRLNEDKEFVYFRTSILI